MLRTHLEADRQRVEKPPDCSDLDGARGRQTDRGRLSGTTRLLPPQLLLLLRVCRLADARRSHRHEGIQRVAEAAGRGRIEARGEQRGRRRGRPRRGAKGGERLTEREVGATER